MYRAVFRHYLVFSLILLMFLSLGSAFGVDDSSSFVNTSTNYTAGQTGITAQNINISFIGTNLTIYGASGEFPFNLTNSTVSNEFISKTSSTPELNTSNATKGRYEVRNSSGENVKIDLVDPASSDIMGRILGSPPSLSLNSVNVYYWNNGSKIDDTQNKLNISTGSFQGMNSHESFYNISQNMGLNKYWLTINASGNGLETVPSRQASKINPATTFPRVNDVNLNSPATINGTVYNWTDNESTPQGGVENIKVTLHKFDGKYGSRLPEMHVPPERQQFTNSEGEFNFTGLTGFGYQLEIENSSMRNNTYNDFEFNTQTDDNSGSIVNRTVDLYLNETTGSVSGELKGEKTSNLRYGMAIINDTENRQYINESVEPGSFEVSGIPAGDYILLAARFNSSGSGFPQIDVATELVEIEEGKTENVGNIGFPSTVEYTVNITDSSNNEPISNAKVAIENKSERKIYFGETNSTGGFTTNVANDTGYDIKVIPPTGSDYRVKSSNTTVNESGQKDEFQLSTGQTLEGYINSTTGEKLSNAEVVAFNFSEVSFDRTTTNGSGYYNLTGLKKDTVHSINVYPEEANLSEAHDQVDVNKTTNNDLTNFTLSAQTSTITGNVSSEGQSLNATINITNQVTGEEGSKSTNSSGGYNFSNVAEETRYKVEIEPDNSNYVSESQFFVIYSNETINFELAEKVDLSGSVKDSNGNSITGARVRAVNNSIDSSDSDLSDSSGNYSLSLKNESYKFEVGKPGTDYETNVTTLDVSQVSGSYDFTISTGSFLAGNVTNNGANLNEDGKIQVWNHSVNVSESLEFQGGEFNVTGLKDESYNVRVKVQNETFKPNKTTVESSSLGGKNDIEMEQRSGRKLELTVNDAGDGGAISGAKVIIGGVQKETNENGTARFDRQPEKTIKALIKAESYDSSREKIKIKARTDKFGGITEWQNETFELENIEELEARINLTNSNDNPVSGATVIFSLNKSSSSQSGAAVTGTSGKATVEGLRKGDYQVAAVMPGGKVYTNSTEIKDGKVTDPDLSLGSKDLWFKVSPE